MTLVSLTLGAFLGFLAGVLAMSLLRVAAFDPPTLEHASDLAGHGRDVGRAVPRERSLSNY